MGADGAQDDKPARACALHAVLRGKRIRQQGWRRTGSEVGDPAQQQAMRAHGEQHACPAEERRRAGHDSSHKALKQAAAQAIFRGRLGSRSGRDRGVCVGQGERKSGVGRARSCRFGANRTFARGKRAWYNKQQIKKGCSDREATQQLLIHNR